MNVFKKGKKDCVPFLPSKPRPKKGRQHLVVNRRQTPLRAAKIFLQRRRMPLSAGSELLAAALDRFLVLGIFTNLAIIKNKVIKTFSLLRVKYLRTQLACSAGVLLERVSVTTLRPPSVRRWGMVEGKSEIFFAPPPPLSFLLPIVHPLGRSFFLSPVFHCLKNSRWRENFLRCERLHEKISPALQARSQSNDSAFTNLKEYSKWLSKS